MVDVNLTAPLLLIHRLAPGMLGRGRGHVVFIASVAGKVGPAFSEPYAATKAGLVGLTQSLRAEYLDAPVGFSVICPGFIAGDGMYARMVQEGHRSNRMMGETSTEKVSEAVVRAVREDRAEMIESGVPSRQGWSSALRHALASQSSFIAWQSHAAAQAKRNGIRHAPSPFRRYGRDRLSLKRHPGNADAC